MAQKQDRDDRLFADRLVVTFIGIGPDTARVPNYAGRT
jgi:hypothetical protein